MLLVVCTCTHPCLARKNLIFFSVVFFFAFSFGGFGTDFFVIFFQSGKIFTGFGEFTFLHTFTDVPVHKGTFGVHQIKFVVQTRKDFGNGGGVGDHADGALDFGQITSWDDSGGLVVDATFETSGAPVHELDGTFGLDGGDGGVDVFGDDITTVHEAAGHVFAVTRVTFGHGGGGFKCTVGDFGHRQLFVVGFFGTDDGRERGKHKVNAWVRHQIGLELRNIDVECTIETKGGGQRRNDLGDQTIQVGVGGALNVQRTTADVVDGFVVEHDGDVGVLQEGVGGQDGVVGFNNSGGDLGGGVDREPELGLLAVVDGQALQEEGAETGAGTTADSVEDHEALEAGAVVRELADAVEAQVHDFLADGVVTTREVVRRIFLAGDKLLGVEQLAVRAGAHFINHGGLEIEENATGHVLARAGFGEKRVERIIAAADGLVGGHLAAAELRGRREESGK